MADRYQDRPFPAHDDYGRGADPHGQSKGESDPLAELARLIGQTDPFAMGRTNAKPQPRSEPRQQYQPQYEPQQYQDEPEAEPEVELSPGPLPWMRRANAKAPPPVEPQYDDEPEYQPSPVHPLQRYAAQQPRPHRRHSIKSPSIRSRSNIRTSRNTPSKRSPIRRAMTMRCMASSKRARTISATRPIPMIPTPTRITTKSRRSSRANAAA